LLLSSDIILLVNCSQPAFLCDSGSFFLTVSIVLSSSTPWLCQCVRLP
jgi:hypothetical protein